MPDSEKVKKMMKARGINQAELSRMTGIKPGNLSHIVNGNVDSKESTLMKLCDGLGCKVEDICLEL